jgi:hypothetical protein
VNYTVLCGTVHVRCCCVVLCDTVWTIRCRVMAQLSVPFSSVPISPLSSQLSVKSSLNSEYHSPHYHSQLSVPLSTLNCQYHSELSTVSTTLHSVQLSARSTLSTILHSQRSTLSTIFHSQCSTLSIVPLSTEQPLSTVCSNKYRRQRYRLLQRRRWRLLRLSRSMIWLTDCRGLSELLLIVLERRFLCASAGYRSRCLRHINAVRPR